MSPSPPGTGPTPSASSSSSEPTRPGSSPSSSAGDAASALDAVSGGGVASAAQAAATARAADDESTPLTSAEVARRWWPLAASWLLMGLELPAVAAVVSRLAEGKIQLAAYGSFVFPVAVFIEAPIIMMLAASTALCRDADSYRRVYRFMMRAGFVLTLVHAIVAFTPLGDFVLRVLMGAPDEVVRPARLGLMAMLPWTWCIAFRRFQQGVMIRHGHSGAVGVGTVVRLLATGSVLALGFVAGTVEGALVGAAAVTFGVAVEAAYAGWRVRPVLRDRVFVAAPGDKLETRAFWAFYAPLALTPLLTLAAPPLVSASMSRMARDVDSLAAWPVVYGLVFLFRCVGMAYNEVVVSLLGRPGSVEVLGRFTRRLAAATTAGLAAVAFTPLGRIWFTDVVDLEPDVAALAEIGLRVIVLLPAMTALQSWYQGRLMHRRRTRPITESTVAMVAALAATLGVGILATRLGAAWVGLYVGVAAYLAGGAANVAWLALACRCSDRRVTSAGRPATAVGGLAMMIAMAVTAAAAVVAVSGCGDRRSSGGAAGLGPDLGRTAPLPRGFEPTDFLSFERDAGGESGRLVTRLATYENDGGARVALVGAVHVADAAYYEDVQRRLEAYDRVLYELVAPEGTIPRPGARDGSPVSFAQRTIRFLLELEFQLDRVDYSRRNFLHADMDPLELLEAQQEAGETMWTLLARWMTRIAESYAAGEELPGPEPEELAKAFTAPDRARRLKLLFAEQFEDFESMLAAVDDGDGTVLVERRNDVVMRRLLERLRAGDRSVAVFYGAAHLPDLERRLVGGLGMRRESAEPLVAWEIGP